ncbi:uncharacterized protein LOC131875992 [Cryptomeria japonica]|uniref:uncharacterized protein LOC131875992 n=1 Tax=Cryptomeria japonica TaxID=3369 RepID=UPI0027DA42C0|nr:uncharacterized protein LOC131875992 [Cryptomeria japonica]
METVDPRTTWVVPMGYEVEEDLVVGHAKYLLAQLIDTTIERFGTYKEKYLLVHSELRKPIIAKKVRKEVEQFVEQQDEEEEQPEKIKTKDLPDDIDIDDFSLDEIVMGNQPVDEEEKIKLVNVQNETVINSYDDTKVKVTGTEEEKKYHIEDIQDEDNIEVGTQAEHIEIGVQAKQTEHSEEPLVSEMVTNNTNASIEKPAETVTKIPTAENKEKPMEIPVVDNIVKQAEKPTES